MEATFKVELICIVDSHDRGMLVSRNEKRAMVLPSLRVDSVDQELHERIGRERPSSVTFAPEAGTQRLRDVINKQITEQEIVTAAEQALRSAACSAVLVWGGEWPMAALRRLQLAAEAGGVDIREMHRVFNMGIGMVAIVPEADSARIPDGDYRWNPFKIGRVSESLGEVRLA